MPPPPNLNELLDARIYPGMTAAETRILREWIRNHGAAYDTLDVEARLGAGTLLPPHYSPKEREDWLKRTKARPDLIATRGPNFVAIVEAKEQLTNEGIWQVLSYRDLYNAEFPQARVQPMVACVAATPTAVALARSQRVQVWLYEFPVDQPLAPGAEAPPS
jgi:hypothetical protein